MAMPPRRWSLSSTGPLGNTLVYLPWTWKSSQEAMAWSPMPSKWAQSSSVPFYS